MSGLARVIEAYRGRVAELASQPMTGDVMDVIDRALAMDESGVHPDLRASAARLVSVDEVEMPAPDLAAFSAALRGRAEQVAEERRLTPLPSPKQRRAWPWTAALAVAAVLALALLGRGLLSSVTVDEDAPQRPSASPDVRESTSPDEHEAAARTPVDEAPAHVPESRPTTTPSQQEAVAPEATPAVPELDPADEPTRKAPPRKTLDELEALAHQRWTDGDLAGAESALRRVIARAGRGRRADLAFGDLFAVVRAKSGPDAEAREWSRYLERFPRGRFADDARAGLCRRASGSQRAQCWGDYLKAHPTGAHARQARRESGASP